ncbi:uncharacterized protein CIMG_11486 [Coccidioides immitis RS]|uniref:Uncharacterized protein n=2 Tax=Coccidioides immitis TaxID=5501 RepID=A0A0D8JW27_COCIM|nr:uncharacterized protein CIMG_11486 [Coccidioides immitis RS]KJF61116.1 hypothetical protein CIMG_11486 [Coccidioides immitis RS]KMP05367.1 hypothetical protein CIRG_05048 [Coccidioides immitis RMSCC 2394]
MARAQASNLVWTSLIPRSRGMADPIQALSPNTRIRTAAAFCVLFEARSSTATFGDCGRILDIKDVGTQVFGQKVEGWDRQGATASQAARASGLGPRKPPG